MFDGIGSRYREGVLVEEIDCRVFGVFDVDDYPIHRLYAKAVAVQNGFDPIVFRQTETVEIDSNGQDIGYIEADIYVVARMPFPRDVGLRKQFIRGVVTSYSV